MTQAEEMVRAVQTLAGPGQWVEVRAVQFADKTKARHAFFRVEDAIQAARQASEWERNGRPKAIYISLNLLRDDVHASGHYVNKGDIAAIRWLMVDCEHLDHSDHPASEDEKRASWKVLARARSTLEAAGFVGACVGDSGNGWHLLYPLDLPANEASEGQIKALLVGLSERCSDTAARVDPSTYKLHQATKFYGTLARRGEPSEGRPHHQSWLVEAEPWELARAAANAALIAPLLARWAAADEMAGKAKRPKLESWQRETQRQRAYALEGLKRECEAVAGEGKGNRVNRLFAAACAAGNLIAKHHLSRGEAEAALIEAGRAAGLYEDPEVGERGVADQVRRGIDRGMTTPREAPPEANGVHAKPKTTTEEVEKVLASAPDVDPADVATIDDLIRLGAEVRWVWPGWIQQGVCTVIAAEPGTGKTRFVMDLLRRVRHGLTWPDGAAMSLPADAVTLFVMADNHHDEMVTLSQAFGVKDVIRINAPRADPYGGTLLDDAKELALLDSRIRAVKPAFVVIDTVGNSTDKNLSRSEEAKAYYQPLQVLARRHACALLCITHLNAGGTVLGRRAVEKVRGVIKMDCPDPEGQPNRRWLGVTKTNQKKPSPLGVTMGDAGNEYDNDPPRKPEDEPGSFRKPGRPSTKQGPCEAWLEDRLSLGAARVSVVRREAEQVKPDKGGPFSKGPLYRARDALGVIEYEEGRYLWWRLAETVGQNYVVGQNVLANDEEEEEELAKNPFTRSPCGQNGDDGK